LRIAVVGLGSMGQRRIRLLKRYDAAFIIAGIDNDPGRAESARDHLGIETYTNLEDALSAGADAVFVSTSPLSHSGIIRTALEAGCHVFTELNLVTDGYDGNIARAKEKNLVLFLSSTMMYRREVGLIKEAVHASTQNACYIYHSGQWLPDWHPWENYKDFFVGDKRTNGCREVMAIELPWLTGVFGNVRATNAVHRNITSLDIDFPDYYSIQIEHESGSHGVFCVDIASQKAVRNLEVYGESLYMTWNGTPGGLYQYDDVAKGMKQMDLSSEAERLAAYNETIVEDAYYAEIEDFFNVIAGKSSTRYTFEKDADILALIDRIESGTA